MIDVRPLSDSATAAWAEAVAGHVPQARALLLVGGDDLERPLAARFAATVTRIEPDGLPSAQHDTDGPYDAAVLDCVVQNLPDRDEAAVCIEEALRPGGAVLVRQMFAGRVDGLVHLRYFPTALAIAERTYPSVEDVCGAFGRAGFDFVALETVRQESDVSAAVYAERIARSTLPLLRDIPDDELQQGLAEMREDAASASAPPTPIVEWMDLLVLRLPG